MESKITVTEPCSFKITFPYTNEDRVLNIMHASGGVKGKCYHFRVFPEPPVDCVVSFPIPGIYTSSIPFIKIEKGDLITKDIIDELPPFERDFSPAELVVKYDPNLMHTPARTIAKIGLIFYSPKLDTYPTQVKYFILLHEKGHQRYKTEWKTDLCALYWFLQQGYNESQALMALSRVLKRSPEAIQRIKNIHKVIMRS